MQPTRKENCIKVAQIIAKNALTASKMKTFWPDFKCPRPLLSVSASDCVCASLYVCVCLLIEAILTSYHISLYLCPANKFKGNRPKGREHWELSMGKCNENSNLAKRNRNWNWDQSVICITNWGASKDSCFMAKSGLFWERTVRIYKYGRKLVQNRQVIEYTILLFICVVKFVSFLFLKIYLSLQSQLQRITVS